MNRAVFLDRDGVINRKAATEDEYITRWEEIEILPGVAEAIASLNRAGFQVIVITNQRAVAKGLMTTATLEGIHQRLMDYLALSGARIDGFYYCPHELEPPCSCRKPQPGMLFEAARAHNIDLTLSWMVGDSEKDVEAGKRAACRTVHIVQDGLNHGPEVTADSLLAAASKILRY